LDHRIGSCNGVGARDVYLRSAVDGKGKEAGVEFGVAKGGARLGASAVNVVSKKAPFGLLLLNMILAIRTSANAYMRLPRMH
jgi:hypothetical protein